MKLTFLTGGMLLLRFLAACSGLPAASQLATDSITPFLLTQIPSATTVWFPPTDTPTFFPTQAEVPTQDQKPGILDLLFTDTFDQPALWINSQEPSAGATVVRNQLLLSIFGQGPLTAISLRSQPILSDFFAEVTLNLSLCEGKDQAGMLFRAESSDNYYRFTVSCDGQTRLERVVSGSLLPLTTWLSTGDAPIAAPSEVKLGVWAVGGDLRFFLNDHLQFTFRDISLHAGTLGFFAFASGAAPITASFSNLSVYSVAYVSPVPSLTPSRTPTETRMSVPRLTPTP